MVDSDHDDATTPRKRNSYRIAQLKDFLPLGHDLPSPLATRGQHLQGLIQSRSSSNLAGLRTNRWSRANSAAPQPESQGRRGSAGSDELHDPEFFRTPLSQQVSHLSTTAWPIYDDHERRMSHAASVLMGPEMRSQRLIGSTNPRYRWEQYWTPEEDLKKMRKPLRKYYERNNDLIQNYRYIDELLDSSLPHDLIQEYNTQVAQNVGYGSIQGRPALQAEADVPETISEEDDEEYHPRLYTERHGSFDSIMANGEFWANGDPPPPMQPKVKRTPRDIYRLKKDDSNGSDERQPLLTGSQDFAERTINDDLESGKPMPPDLEIEDEADSDSPIVTRAIWINTIANFVLLILKIVVVVLSSSVSVLASLVDAALDFLSTAIVGLTTWMISRTDSYQYPIGRRRLEPVGVLVFSVIMITAFLQVFYEAFVKLTSGDREVVQLSPAAIAIMASTVVVKGLCWVWCRLIKNSSVQALAQDAMTDVVFNTFSIIFPLVGYYANIWFLDPLGGVLLSLYVIVNWSHTANEHICNLAGASASADERNILLYLTMRFAKTIKQIQGLQAYHSGDKLNVEVDIVLDETTSLRDSHDLGESLQYVLESVPSVDRAFVHMDYLAYNIPTHMNQHS